MYDVKVIGGKNKKMKMKIAAIAATVTLIVFIASAYALNVSFMMHQTLTVPGAPAMTVYQSDGVTQISAGQDISPQWIWTGTQFYVTLIIHNTGNTPLNISLDTSLAPSNWAVTIDGNGPLAIGGVQTVTLIAVPPLMASGTTSGDFDLRITG
jgi:hypothetical protein